MSFQNRLLARAKRSAKKMSPAQRRRSLFEQLEARNLLAVGAIDDGTMPPTEEIWLQRVENESYYPRSVSQNLVGKGFLTGPQTGNKVDIAMNYLRQNAASFGVKANDFLQSRITSSYVTQQSGTTHVYLQQMYNGLPIEGAVANVSVTANGRVLTAASSFIPNLDYPANPQKITPQFDAAMAFHVFLTESGLPNMPVQSVTVDATSVDRSTVLSTGTNNSDIYASLHYVPKKTGGVELSWRVMNIRTPDGEHGLDLSISLEGSRASTVVRAADWVAHAAYNVFPFPAEGPGQTAQTFVIDPYSTTASPFGWHDIDGVIGSDTIDTTGNNVIAMEDRNGNNGVGLTAVSPSLIFDFLVQDRAPASTYTMGAITHMFYATNYLHDVAFHYGFDEAAGNFQVTNYTAMGAGGDPLLADVQDGSGFNNANMLTPPDGISPRMQQFIWLTGGAVTDRDSSLDNLVIAHEFMHGISNRLTGGPADANALLALQSGGMGEGWGDWFGAMLTIKPGDTAFTPRPVATYLEFQDADDKGIRRWPYSYDMTVNPLTLGDFNGGFPANEVHFAGEIWTQVLWDMSWLLINKYGFDPDYYNGDGGNNLAMQLVFDGMKLQPANPTFLQARDAIVAADLALTGGENYADIWKAFARRGFGINAYVGEDADSEVVLENFEEPPPPAQISGLVWNDMDNDKIRDAVEPGIAGITIYADANNNFQLDANEPRTVSAFNGTYDFTVFTGGTITVRQVLPATWQQTFPVNGGGHTIDVSQGGVFTNRNFGDRGTPGEIHGIKFHDWNGDGVRQADEPGFQGILVYVDINHDGKIGIGEMGAYTDVNGVFTIKDVPPGTYTVREALSPGYIATMPAGDPANGIPAGVHFGIVVNPGAITTGLLFGNTAALDWGDAPESYGTSAAANGPSHGLLPGFRLGSYVDAEGNGTPSVGADADDLSPVAADDDDGIVPRTAFTPGAQAIITATAQTGGITAGWLQGWIDFDGNGTFDADEQIIKDHRLFNNTPTDFTLNVPADAVLGARYARFRYSHERGLGPNGATMTGEVEDYLFQVLDTVPVAIDDSFSVKQDSIDNVFDVTVNDVGSASDNGAEPTIFNVQTTTDQGGTVVLDTATNSLVYTPRLGYIGPDRFTYTVRDGLGVESNEAIVNITVLPGDPRALSDTFRVDTNVSDTILNVYWNDVAGPTGRIDPASVTQPVYPVGVVGGSLVLDQVNNRFLYTPPANFQGTVQFSYDIIDSDDTTDDDRYGPATVTVQVTPGAGMPASGQQAQLEVRLTDANGVPLAANDAINVGETFFIEVYTRDLRPGGNVTNRGVEAAYLDLLYNRTYADPVRDDANDPGNPSEFDVEFQGGYDENNGFDWNAVLQDPPGFVDEVGAAHDSSNPNLPMGIGSKLMVRVRMTATTATNSFQVVADPADAPEHQVVLFDGLDPLDLDFTQVFYVASPTIRILGPEPEGEFSNVNNRLDVNDDGHVTGIDALIVINDMNNLGSRDVSQLALATSGVLPPSNFIDVNGDGFITGLDALWIINHLNASGGASQQSFTGGEGEGESVAAATLAAVAAPVVTSAATESSGSTDDSLPGNSSPTLSLTGSLVGDAEQAEGEASGAAETVVPQSSAPAIDFVAVDLLMSDSDDVVTGGNSDGDDADDLLDGFDTLSGGLRALFASSRR